MSGTLNLDVEVPGGGTMTLASPAEVDLWNQAAEAYKNEYGFTKVNDLKVLGVILTFGIQIHRAQQDMADPSSKTASDAGGRILKWTAEVRELEKQLGIDKKSREAGGQHTIADYLTRLKRAANEKGVHILERVKGYEAICMKARTDLRMLRNCDAEDLRQNGLSTDSFLAWLEAELGKLEQKDKDWAKSKGRLWAGQL